MVFKLTPRVIYETQRIFGVELSKSIFDTFMNTDFFCNYEEEVERIRLAILHGSEGDYGIFMKIISISKSDYRDVLTGSGLENENWKDILNDAGFKSIRKKNFNSENANRYTY